jgi:hypothetical protein
MTDSSKTCIRELRCPACGALLARIEAGAVRLSRGGLQAAFHGVFHASLVCHRPCCRRLTVFRHES